MYGGRRPGWVRPRSVPAERGDRRVRSSVNQWQNREKSECGGSAWRQRVAAARGGSAWQQRVAAARGGGAWWEHMARRVAVA